MAAEESSEIAKIYTNIRRWRGGQLAINAAAGGNQFYATSAIKTDYEAKIVFLPCSKYNLSQIGQGEVNRDLRQRCCVCILKAIEKDGLIACRQSFAMGVYKLSYKNNIEKLFFVTLGTFITSRARETLHC